MDGVDEVLARMEIDLTLPSWMDEAPGLRSALCDLAGPGWPDTLPGAPV